jgi:hypothetical protein
MIVLFMITAPEAKAISEARASSGSSVRAQGYRDPRLAMPSKALKRWKNCKIVKPKPISATAVRTQDIIVRSTLSRVRIHQKMAVGGGTDLKARGILAALRLDVFGHDRRPHENPGIVAD